jgi:hypothetical protein
MNYELIRQLLRELEGIEQALDRQKTIDLELENKITTQDYYQAITELNRALGFFKAGQSNMYFHIGLDEYDVSDIGLNEFGNLFENEMQGTLEKDPELAISLEHTSNALKDAFDRVCISLDEEV